MVSGGSFLRLVQSDFTIVATSVTKAVIAIVTTITGWMKETKAPTKLLVGAPSCFAAKKPKKLRKRPAQAIRNM
jgi:hypothetical protein